LVSAFWGIEPLNPRGVSMYPDAERSTVTARDL
jgi:hypothetical protein